jgi:hypothetical protein
VTGYTARWFLGVDDDTLSRSVEQSGALHDLLGHLGRALGGDHAAVAGAVGTAVGGALAVDLGAILLDGWRGGTQLRTAARTSLATPNSSVVVDLARHRISYTYQPHVDLAVDGHQVGSVAVVLSLVFDVASAQATVRAGRLSALRCGQTDLTAALQLAGRRILDRTGTIDAAAVLPLGTGIPLLTAAELGDATVPLS